MKGETNGWTIISIFYSYNNDSSMYFSYLFNILFWAK